MGNSGSFYLFAFHSVASFLRMAGALVAGMALILPDPDWDKAWRGAIVFVIFGLIAQFAGQALDEGGS